MADRILGMGDVLTLIEKAEQVYEEEQAAEAAQRLMDGSFTFDDFIEQLHQVKKMGSIGSLVGMLPGIPKELRNTNIDEREIAKVEAIVYSMTPAERVEPSLINGSRRQRIAAGSGTSTAQVGALLRQFEQMQKMMKSMAPGLGLARRKAKKGKKKAKGGRVTPRGGGPAPTVPDLSLRLPGR